MEKLNLRAENLIKSYCKKHRINYGILRFFNVARSKSSGKNGTNNKGDHLFKNLSVEIYKKKPHFKIYGHDYKTPDGHVYEIIFM